MIDTLANDRTEYFCDETRNEVIESTTNNRIEDIYNEVRDEIRNNEPERHYQLIDEMSGGFLHVFIELAFDLDEIARL